MPNQPSQTRAIRRLLFFSLGSGALDWGILVLAHGSFMSGRYNPVLVTRSSDPFTFWSTVLIACGLGVVGLSVAIIDICLTPGKGRPRERGGPD